MASKKKDSEAIALLSMYGDEDDNIDADVDSDDGSNTKNDDNAVPAENKEQSETGAKKTANIGKDDSETFNSSNIMSYINEGNLDSANENSTQPPPPVQQATQQRRLPPPPTTKCSDELQEMIIKFQSVKKKTGRSFNSEARNRKDYRNPEFLTHAVSYQNIDGIGSCFKIDFYIETEADVKRDVEGKDQKIKKTQMIDFEKGRPNKKSKWDRSRGKEGAVIENWT